MLSPCVQTGRPSSWRWWSPTLVPLWVVRLDAGMGIESSHLFAHVRPCFPSVPFPHTVYSKPLSKLLEEVTSLFLFTLAILLFMSSHAFVTLRHSALTSFGYHEVTPIVRKDGQEYKLPSFSICCSMCWQLHEQLHHLTCSNSLLHVCLIALHLCQSPEQTRDPYWDVMCKMALEGGFKQPHALRSMGFPNSKAANLPIRDLFSESE